MVRYCSKYHSEDTTFWISLIVNSSDSALRATTGQEGWGRFCQVVYPLGFALRATTQHDGKAGGLQILCCKGIKVTDYNFTPDVLALKPSGFYNVSVGYELAQTQNFLLLTESSDKSKKNLHSGYNDIAVKELFAKIVDSLITMMAFIRTSQDTFLRHRQM